MKKCLIILLIFLAPSCTQSELDESVGIQDAIRTRSVAKNTGTHYYWCDDYKVNLTEISQKRYILFKKDKIEEINAFATRAGEAFDISNVNDYELNINVDSELTKLAWEGCAWARANLPDMSENSAVLYSAPFFLTQNGCEVGLTNLFSVKLKQESDITKLNIFAQKHKVSIVEKDLIMVGWYLLACTSKSTGNALEMANAAYESGEFSQTDVSFIDDIKPSVEPSLYNDPLFSNQWNLVNNTYLGIDINFNLLHKITTGNPNVIVAVIDTGMQLDHPDMPISYGWDATSATSPAKLYIYDNNSWTNHGTGTSSLIVAKPNNNIDIVGIAPDVKLMPISVNFVGSKSSNNLAAAISYATPKGAAIISNSWSGKQPHSKINEAVRYALSSGRNGKGSVLVFSSGNESWNKDMYPHAMFPPIINVGNMTRSGKRSSSSNFGTHLDVVAPGTSIPTLAPNGNTGISDGTSFACPQVAAIAALVLSANPNLTVKQVADVIENSAQKLSGYNFTQTSGRNNGPWNVEVGYGLVDAFNSVASSLPPIVVSNLTFSAQTNCIYINKNIVFDNIAAQDQTIITAKAVEYINCNTLNVQDQARFQITAFKSIILNDITALGASQIIATAKEITIQPGLTINAGANLILTAQ